MLEAVNTDLVFHHQPEAQHPKSSAIHKLPADYPISGWWRPRPELNRGKRFCRPLRNHSATWPYVVDISQLISASQKAKGLRATEIATEV
jgi:hypothetical protein